MYVPRRWMQWCNSSCSPSLLSPNRSGPAQDSVINRSSCVMDRHTMCVCVYIYIYIHQGSPLWLMTRRAAESSCPKSFNRRLINLPPSLNFGPLSQKFLKMHKRTKAYNKINFKVLAGKKF